MLKVPASFNLLLMQFLETPSADEAEVYRNLQVCLEMRQSYVFKEAVAPWVKEVISDPCTPKPNPNPFEFTPEGKSDVSFYVQETQPSLSLMLDFWIWYMLLLLFYFLE